VESTLNYKVKAYFGLVQEYVRKKLLQVGRAKKDPCLPAKQAMSLNSGRAIHNHKKKSISLGILTLSKKVTCK
jgi:hypothetical protein